MIKGALAFAAVGVIVGLLMPTIAGALISAGIVGEGVLLSSGVSAGSLAVWQGTIFGIFGFLAPPLQQVCHNVFGNPEARDAARHNAESQQMKAEIMELEGREQALEQAVLPRSPAVARILATREESFAKREQTREDNTPKMPTIH